MLAARHAARHADRHTPHHIGWTLLWLVGTLVDRLTGLSALWLIGSLAGRQAHSSALWLLLRPSRCSTHSLAVSLVNRHSHRRSTCSALSLSLRLIATIPSSTIHASFRNSLASRVIHTLPLASSYRSSVPSFSCIPFASTSQHTQTTLSHHNQQLQRYSLHSTTNRIK